MVVLRDIFILKIFRWGAEARSSDEMRVVSEILPKWCQKNYHFFSAESLEVVLREESWEKITSVRKRLSAWWSSGARKVEKKSQVSENDQVLGGSLARGKSTWDLWFFGQVLVVVARDGHLGVWRKRCQKNDFVFILIFKIVNEMPSVGKIEKLQRQRSARRDKSSGPLPFLFDVLYFCIFKIHFPSQIQLCVCLQDFARIWPDSGQTPWSMVWRSWFLLRFRAYLVESGLRSLFIIKIFRLDFSSRFCPDTRGFRSDPMRYGLGKLVFLSFSSLSRRIRTRESLEDFDDILHLQAFSFIFFFKISGRSS